MSALPIYDGIPDMKVMARGNEYLENKYEEQHEGRTYAPGRAQASGCR